MPLLKNKYSALHPSPPPCPLQTSKKIKTHPVSTPIVFLCYLFACFYQSSETEDKGACSPNGFASSSHVTRLLLAAVLVRGHSGYCCSPGAELHRAEREELGGAAATTPRPQARSLPAGRQAGTGTHPAFWGAPYNPAGRAAKRPGSERSPCPRFAVRAELRECSLEATRNHNDSPLWPAHLTRLRLLGR